MRFGAAIVAFAIAIAVVSRANVLPEFLVQVRDPNMIGGLLFSFLLKTFGYAIVSALCAVLTGATVLLVAWRTRTRGAPDSYAMLAAILAAFCLIGRLGVSLDPIGWICAASFALVLERDGRAVNPRALAIVALWSLLQGGALMAGLLALLAFAGAFIDARTFDDTVHYKAVLARGAIVLGALQLHALPWHAYGAHIFYLDAFASGAQRDRLWTGGFSLQMASFCAVVIVAGWYGVHRRGRATDALSFFALMLLAIADSRNLPYFGIVAGPIVADAVASYFVDMRKFPSGSVRRYAVAFCAAAFSFLAWFAATEPKAVSWPRPAEQPASLLHALAKDHRDHELLCEQPRWCDGAETSFPNLHPLIDDRAGITPRAQRSTQADAVATRGAWRRELTQAGVDAVIARKDANIVALLTSFGWRETKADGARVLLHRSAMR
jgi:hypothetical protein